MKDSYLFMYKVVRSFRYAIAGILSGFQERNMKVHGVAAVLVLLLCFLLPLTQTEWHTILILIGLVFSAELINTAIEEICNLLRDDLGLAYHATKRARDVAAGAVLVLALSAATVGASILLPKVLMLF